MLRGAQSVDDTGPDVNRVIRAPGKLVLLGEYAVLDGVPAVVAAIDHGVVCTVHAGQGIRTPGDDTFVCEALLGAPPALYEFDDWNPVLGIGGKPGFGGSAAATVAACLAAGRSGMDAFDVHAKVQGGGSGIDVAASLWGGVRRYQLGQRVAGSGMDLPAFSVIWSGQSSRTAPRVHQYLAWPGRAAFCARMQQIVDRYEADPVEAIADGYDLLCAMSREAGIEYDLTAFQRIDEIAATYGGAAKPSGAGGGDIAVAVFASDEDRRGFEVVCAADGLVVIPTQVCLVGAG